LFLLTYLIVAVDLASPLEEFQERKPLNTRRQTPVLDELITMTSMAAGFVREDGFSGEINPFPPRDGEIFLCKVHQPGAYRALDG
jgi:hypothetical protein